MITYEEYQVPEASIKRMKNLCLSKWIQNYYNTNKRYPSDEEIEDATIWGTQKEESLKRTMYARYLANEYSINRLTVNTPLTFDILSDGEVKWSCVVEKDVYWVSGPPYDADTDYVKTIEYSKNGGKTWTPITSTLVSGDSEASVISVTRGERVMFRGNNIRYNWFSAERARYYNTFSGTTCTFNVIGNMMSLLDATNYSSCTTLESFAFANIFSDCISMVNANKLLLPATTVTEHCYFNMFAGCTSLINPPELPATTLAKYCYNSMFAGCTSLINPPELPATTLANDGGVFGDMGCYAGMFEGCTSLVNAPELPATTLAHYCYTQMFAGCTSLVNAPELPATTLEWFCYQSMFEGCTSLVNAPELPATTLVDYCYHNMFSGCSTLNYIKCLASDISARDCTYGWVDNVATSGTFVKSIELSSIPTGANGIPEGWTVENEGEEPEQCQLSFEGLADEQNVSFPSSGGAVTFLVNSTCEWSVSGGGGWLKIKVDGTSSWGTTASGPSGTIGITISADTCDEEITRSATLVFESGNVTKNLTVNQIVTANPKIQIAPSMLVIGQNQTGTTNLYVSNVSELSGWYWTLSSTSQPSIVSGVVIYKDSTMITLPYSGNSASAQIKINNQTANSGNLTLNASLYSSDGTILSQQSISLMLVG